MDNPTTRLLIVLLVLFSVVSTAAVTSLIVKKNGGGVSTGEVEDIVYNYLKNNPEAIVNAFNEARDKQEQLEAENAKKIISERKDEISNDPTTPFIGASDADVVMVEFFDYNCGYCKKVIPDLLKLIEEDKKLKIVLKDFPILGPQSFENSKAALAFYKLNKAQYQDFFISMMKTTPRNDEQLFALAEKYGVKKDDLKKGMEDAAVTEQLRKNMALGEAIGVRGTPSFIVGGEFVRGAIDIESFRKHISDARSNKKR